MKTERLFELLSEFDEKFIEESENITLIKAKKENRHTLLKLIAACVCLLLISGAVIGIVRNSQITPIAPEAVITPDPDYTITFEDLPDPLHSPLSYGTPALSSNGSTTTLAADEYHPFGAITVRLLEILPDVYTFYDNNEMEYMLLKMETLNVLKGNNIPKEFYYLIPEGCFTDFSIYDRFVVADVVQFGYDYSVMYNITKDCPEIFDMVLLGNYYNGVIGNMTSEGMIAFDKNGNLDPKLFESTEGFSYSTGWHKEDLRKNITEKFTTLEITEKFFRNNSWSGYLQNDFFVCTFSDFSYKAQLALEYLKNTDNGLYVPELRYYSTTYTRQEEKVVFRRYIDGIATNETITLYPYKAEYSTANFQKSELSSAPKLRFAYKKICEEFEAGNITPPNLETTESMECTVNGIFPWYAKTEKGVVGIIQVSWCYKNCPAPAILCYDDAYFIVMPDSNTCTQIDRNELLEMFEDFETTYIYTGEYDNQGKVYEGRSDEYIIVK